MPWVIELPEVTSSVVTWGKYALGVTCALYGAIKLTSVVQRRMRRRAWEGRPKNVVVLHRWPGNRYSPSLSPFALKLETYLRMAGIMYEVDFSEPFGPVGKCPWITFNGEEYTDSQRIIEFLGRYFGKDFSSHLTPEQRALGRSLMVMTEERFFWGSVPNWRFLTTNLRAFQRAQDIPWHVMWFCLWPLKFTIRKNLHYRGLTQHSKEDLEEMMMADLQALSDSLGSKPYFLGDKATEYDCGLFGVLAQVVWGMHDSPYEKAIQGLPNLKDYCFRMKEAFWPDWNKCLDPPVQ